MNAGNNSNSSTALPSPARHGLMAGGGHHHQDDIRPLSNYALWLLAVGSSVPRRACRRAQLRTVSLAACLALASASCDEGLLTPTAARGITWRLESMEIGGSTTAVPDPDRYTIRLEADGRLGVRADCNTCAASYVLSGRSLSIPAAMACTRAFCGTSSLDTAFLSALGGPREMDVSDTNMALRGPGVVLRFRR